MINQKIKIVFFILLFCTTHFFSQLKHAKITYKKKSTTEIKKTKKKETYIDKMFQETRDRMTNFEYTLSFNNKESFFKEVSKMSLDNNNSISFKLSRLFGETNGSFYLDRNTGKTFHLKEFEAEFFLIEYDKITDWKLTREQKKIGEYNCYKATKEDTYINSSGEHIVYNVVAWYAIDLPYPYGPTKYNGLPGVILELVNRKANIYASRIELNPKKKEEIKKPNKGYEVTKIKYDSIVTGLAIDFSKRHKRN